jgi:regulatory protein YycI of two-component signal transduction system YycFG
VNWETTKTWLIVSFLLLDLFLGWQWFENRQEMLSYTETNADLLANTKTLLANHGLTLDTAVPTSEPSLPTLKGQFAKVSLTRVAHAAFPGAGRLNATADAVSAPSGSVHLVAPGNWEVTCTPPRAVSVHPEDTILKLVWQGQNYRLDQDLNTTGAMVFDQTYDGYPIFDVTVDASYDGAHLFGYTETELSNIAAASDPKPVISALDALDSLANSMDKSSVGTDNRIHSVRLGYAEKLTNALGIASASNYWFPVWRVAVGTTVYYINAFSGEVEPAPE